MSVGPPGGVVRQSADPSLLTCRGGLHRERGAEYRAVLASPTLWQTANRGVLPIGPGGRAHPASDSLTAWLLRPAILLTSLSVGLGGEGERGARQGAAAFSRTGALVLATLGGRAGAVSPTCLGASACPPGGGSPTPRGHTAPRPRSGFASRRSEPAAWRRGGRGLLVVRWLRRGPPMASWLAVQAWPPAGACAGPVGLRAAGCLSPPVAKG